MNKLQLLKQQLIKRLFVAFMFVAAAGGFLFLSNYLLDAEVQRRNELEQAVATDQSLLSNIRNKLDQSTVAEKRYAEIVLKRPNTNLDVRNDVLVQQLREEKAHYRLTNAKLNLVPEAVVSQPELTHPNFEVAVRDGVGVEFDAISDVHVYSFIEDFTSRSGGFVRVKSVDIERKGDLSPAAITQLISGQNISIVSAKLQFMLVGIQPKEIVEPPAAAGGAASPQPPGGKP